MTLPLALLPDVSARLIERLVFNFRVPLDWLHDHLPDGIRPQAVAGHGVASFCTLDLAGVTAWGIPHALGLDSLNAAWRYGVVDRAGRPAVWVDQRLTASALKAGITRMCPGVHAKVDMGFETHEAGARTLTVRTPTGAPVFEATFSPAQESGSSLFASPSAFAAFIADGVRSYSPSVSPALLNVVDLHKEDCTFEPLRVVRVAPALEVPLAFDSAFRTTGGVYRWSLEGQVRRGRAKRRAPARLRACA